MGKITKIFYVCDLCGEEDEDKMETCKCEKEYCGDCAASIRIRAEYYIDNEHTDLVSLYNVRCKECIQKEVDEIKTMGPKEVAGKFIIKAE